MTYGHSEFKGAPPEISERNYVSAEKLRELYKEMKLQLTWAREGLFVTTISADQGRLVTSNPEDKFVSAVRGELTAIIEQLDSTDLPSVKDIIQRMELLQEHLKQTVVDDRHAMLRETIDAFVPQLKQQQ